MALSSSRTDSKLICIPGLVIGGIDNGVEGGNDTTCGLDIVGAAAVATGVSLQVRCWPGDLVRLTHLTGNVSLPPPLRQCMRGAFGFLHFVRCTRKSREISQYL